jgi:hypothetical protein
LLSLRQLNPYLLADFEAAQDFDKRAAPDHAQQK